MAFLEDHLQGIITELKLPTEFSNKTVAAAAQIPAEISKEEKASRRDLRSQLTVTIDGETARDFDDAISVEDIGRNHLRLRVSIADVSHYVTAGSAIDREALARGNSIYFPNHVIPMLPEKLSNNICSLVPDEDRLTITAEIDFDHHAKVLRTDFYKSVIRSAARLTYRQVARALIDKEQETRHELRQVLPHLETMQVLFERLRRTRLERGSLDFDLPEPEIIMNFEETEIETIIRAKRTAAHMMIEEFMIAANEAVARFITQQKAPVIYRIHESPNREKLVDLQRMLHNLGYGLRIGRRQLAPKTLAAIVAKAQDKPEARVVHTLILRSLAKAIYSTDNKGHFGLASKCYTHFTSPIRRYPDLIVHRILSQLIGGDASPHNDPRQLARTAEHCSLRERLAMEAEWAMRDLMVAFFMEKHVGETYSGIISGVTKFGLFVELERYFVEGLVHIRTLKDDYYQFVEGAQLLRGRKTKKKYRLGDRVSIQVSRVDTEKRWVDFVLTGAAETP